MFICSTLFIRISIKSRTNIVMVICLSVVIDYLVTWNTWYAISYVFGITLFFLFFLVTSSDCEESNVYHLKTISMIQLELAVVFLLSQPMYFLTICFMYVPYLLFNYALYIFVHIFTVVEMSFEKPTMRVEVKMTYRSAV
jgi:asparagine N-glycosylation enzyme membrane subunit Stt3